jgi:hypothetical protein
MGFVFFRSALGSAEVAYVVVGLSHANLELGVARDAEFLACAGPDPVAAAVEFVFAKAAHAFHDFRRAGVEGQAGGQDYAHRQLGAIGQGQVMADAFAVKVHVGLGGDGYAVDFFGGHGSEFPGRF